MKQDFIYFGENGMTSTHANYIANIAKEVIQSTKAELEHLRFYSTSMTLLGGTNKTPIQLASTKKSLDDISGKLDKIVAAHSLIAWLREAIKAKQRLVKEVQSMDIAEWAKLNDVELPQRPVRESVMTEDEYMATLTVKERNLIYHLQTKVSVIGGFIHPHGSYSNARKEMVDKIHNPNRVSGDGRDTIIYSYEPAFDVDYIDAKFLDLQKKYKDAQAELNGLLHKRDEAIAQDRLEKENSYALALEDFQNKMHAVNARFAAYIDAEVKRLSEMKIVIPNSLKEIFEWVQSIGVSSTDKEPQFDSTYGNDTLSALRIKLGGR